MGGLLQGHQMSVRDLGLLAEKLITDFPEYYPMFAEQTYEFDGRAPANTRNRNPLLGLRHWSRWFKNRPYRGSWVRFGWICKTRWAKNNFCSFRLR